VIGLDTNVLLRYLVGDDAAQARRADLELAGGERFLIDCIVLCELVWVLERGYGVSRADIPGTLERILTTAQFEIDGKDLVAGALDDFRRSTADFADCLLGRRNRGAGASETVTFDRRLRGIRGFRLL
jgi:predicted nucleic-acid-binding protein